MRLNSFLSVISLASVLTIVNCSPNNADIATVLFSDVKSNLNEYISLVQNNPTFSFPTALINYFTAITTYTDDSYTTLLSDFPGSEIVSLATELPWYSSRLETKLESAVTAGGSASDSGSTVTASASTSSNESKGSAALSSALSSFSSKTVSSGSGTSQFKASSSSAAASSQSNPSASGSISSIESKSSAFGVTDHCIPSFLVVVAGIFSSVFIL